METLAAVSLFVVLVLPISVFLCTYAHFTVKAAIVAEANDRDLKSREAYNEKVVSKLRDLAKASGSSALGASLDFTSTDPFSNLN